MDSSIKMVIGIGLAIFIFLLLAVVAVLIVPTMHGTGVQIAEEMGVNETLLYNNTVEAAENTSETQGTMFGILGFVAVAFGFIAIVLGRNFIRNMVGGKVG